MRCTRLNANEIKGIIKMQSSSSLQATMAADIDLCKFGSLTRRHKNCLSLRSFSVVVVPDQVFMHTIIDKREPFSPHDRLRFLVSRSLHIYPSLTTSALYNSVDRHREFATFTPIFRRNRKMATFSTSSAQTLVLKNCERCSQFYHLDKKDNVPECVSPK